MELLLKTILILLRSLSQSVYLKEDILSFLGVAIPSRFSSWGILVSRILFSFLKRLIIYGLTQIINMLSYFY